MTPKEEAFKKYSQTIVKARLHKQLFGSIVYFIVIFSAGLSLTLFTISGRIVEDDIVPVTIFSLFYATGMIAMIWIMIYLGQNRWASLECIEAKAFTGDKIRYSLRGDTINRYLRFGLCLFAVMSVAYCVARCYQMTVERIVTAGNVILHTFRITFLITETVFILLFHKLVILTLSRLFKYLIMHLVAINLCTLVHISSVNIAAYRNADDPQYLSEWSFTSQSVLQYFSPAVVEFSTISVVVLYELAYCAGHLDKVKPRIDKMQMYKRKGSRIWIVVGCTLAGCTVIFMVALEIIGYRLGTLRHILHMVEVGIFTLLALTLCSVSCKLLGRLKFTWSHSRKLTEEKLLLITATMAILYFVARLFLSIGYICKGSTTSNLDVQLLHCQTVLSIFQIVHVVLQTCLLQDNFYRCCQDTNMIAERPGRTTLTLLTFINISLWVIHSFQVTKNDQLFKISNDNSITDQMGAVYNLVQFIMPMVMLYYFISAVCTQVARKHAYLEESLRYDRGKDWNNVNRNVFSELPYLNEDTRPFVNDDSVSPWRDSLTYERRADALFGDLPACTKFDRNTDDQYIKSLAAQAESDADRIRHQTMQNSNKHQLKDKQTVSGWMESHEPIGDRDYLFEREQVYTGNHTRDSFDEIADIHKPPTQFDDNGEFGGRHPGLMRQTSFDYKQGRFNLNNAGENALADVYREQSASSTGIGMVDQSSQAYKDYVLPLEEQLVSGKHDEAGDEMRDSFREIIRMQEPSIKDERNDMFGWEKPELVHQTSSDYKQERFSLNDDTSNQVRMINPFSKAFEDDALPLEKGMNFAKQDDDGNDRSFSKSIDGSPNMRKLSAKVKSDDEFDLEQPGSFDHQQERRSFTNAEEDVQANVPNSHKGMPVREMHDAASEEENNWSPG